MNEQLIHNREVLSQVFELICYPPDTLFNTGQLMPCADSQMWQWYSVICAWTADYFESIDLHWILQPHGEVCQPPTLLLGEGNSSLWHLRDYQLYFQKMLLTTQGEEPEWREARWHLEDWAVGTSEDIIWNMECIYLTTINVPDILHTVDPGMVRQLMYWVTSFIEIHSGIGKFNQLWPMMAPYPGFTWFT